MAAPDVYNVDAAKDAGFVTAMAAAVAWHRAASPFYAAMCEQHGFTEADLQGPADLARVAGRADVASHRPTPIASCCRCWSVACVVAKKIDKR